MKWAPVLTSRRALCNSWTCGWHQTRSPPPALDKDNTMLDGTALQKDGWILSGEFIRTTSGNNANPNDPFFGGQWPTYRSFGMWSGICGTTRTKFSTTTLVYIRPSFNLPSLSSKCKSSTQEAHKQLLQDTLHCIAAPLKTILS